MEDTHACFGSPHAGHRAVFLFPSLALQTASACSSIAGISPATLVLALNLSCCPPSNGPKVIDLGEMSDAKNSWQLTFSHRAELRALPMMLSSRENLSVLVLFFLDFCGNLSRVFNVSFPTPQRLDLLI